MVPRLEASGDVWDLIGVRSAQARILALRGQASESAEMARVARVLGPGDRGPAVHRLGSGIGRPGARRARAGRGRRGAAHRGRGLPRCPRQPVLPQLLPAMVRTALAIGEPALAERLVAGYRAPLPLTPSTPSSRRTPPSPRPVGTCHQPPMPTPMPPIAGSGSGSSPSRRSRSSARAGACSGCPDRPRPHPSCSTPARSSSGSKRRPRSPRPTRSCSRRPRSAPRTSPRDRRRRATFPHSPPGRGASGRGRPSARAHRRRRT